MYQARLPPKYVLWRHDGLHHLPQDPAEDMTVNNKKEEVETGNVIGVGKVTSGIIFKNTKHLRFVLLFLESYDT